MNTKEHIRTPTCDLVDDLNTDEMDDNPDDIITEEMEQRYKREDELIEGHISISEAIKKLKQKYSK